ncbi:MAG: hypothetical protein E7632_10380 [Ruminococcaceae bacterium]|nr:hypothetical protein [Oscillospiraceae bacterium]
MQKNVLSVILLMTLLASCAVGCGESAPTGDDQTSESTTGAETVSVESLVGFPMEDNGGEVFTVLADSNKPYDFNAEEASGDVVNDAVYEKLSNVEEYLGITIETQFEPCGWQERGAFNSLFINAVTAGDSTYDLVVSPIVCTMPTAVEGYFIEGSGLTSCDFSHPWWIDNMYENYSVAGKLYGFLGDFTLATYKDMTVIYFNQRIWNEYSAENPYDLVRSGKWTFDKMAELTVGMASDLNGDGAWTTDDDQLAYLFDQVPNGTFQTSFDLDVLMNNGDGMPEYLGLTEKFAAAHEKMAAYISHEGIVGMTNADKYPNDLVTLFGQNNVAAMVGFLYNTEYLRDMTDDYGIVPMPKYDEQQKDYITQLGTSTLMAFVPKLASSADLTSKVLELCGYYSQELVVPKYYEVALKDKYARDTDIPEMLDIIRNGAMIDFLFVYGTSLENVPFTHFRFGGKSTPRAQTIKSSVASEFAKNEKSFMASVEKLYEAYVSLE